MFWKNNKFNILLLISFCFVSIILMLHHELWRDEAQAWCLVRDLNIVQAFNAARLEGHPFLWYLILFPFAKTGCSVCVMQIISFIFVLAASVYLVFKSPFNNIVKTLVLFSSGFIYYLPVIARNYSLIPLFLFILADLYSKRHKHPYFYALTLIILSQTHILMLGFCLIIAIIFAVESFQEFRKLKKINKLFPSCLIGLNFCILFLMFVNMQNVNHAVAFYASHTMSLPSAIGNFAQLYFLYPLNFLGNINIVIFYSLILLITGYFLKYDKKVFLIFSVSLFYQFYVYYRVWYEGITYQKAFLLLLIILFCSWICKKDYNRKYKLLTVIVSIFFAVSTVFSYFISMLEVNYPFSGAKQVSDYIKENLDNENEFFTVGYPFVFTGVSAYLPDKKLYSYMNNYYISYYDFNAETGKTIQKTPDTKYYIVQTDFSMDERYEEIFATDKNIISLGQYNEVFKIYKKRI